MIRTVLNTIIQLFTDKVTISLIYKFGDKAVMEIIFK